MLSILASLHYLSSKKKITFSPCHESFHLLFVIPSLEKRHFLHGLSHWPVGVNSHCFDLGWRRLAQTEFQINNNYCARSMHTCMKACFDQESCMSNHSPHEFSDHCSSVAIVWCCPAGEGGLGQLKLGKRGPWKLTHRILGNDTSSILHYFSLVNWRIFHMWNFPQKMNEGRKEGSFQSLHSEVSVTSATKAGQQKSFCFNFCFFLHCFSCCSKC